MTNLSLSFGDEKRPAAQRKVYQNIIIDRRSKYSVVVWYVESKEEVQAFMKELLRDKYFQKASHNSYSYRIVNPQSPIIEVKNDDGELGAWNCILRELQRENASHCLIVVTRYFGGIHLQADRFKNVIKASQAVLKDFI